MKHHISCLPAFLVVIYLTTALHAAEPSVFFGNTLSNRDTSIVITFERNLGEGTSYKLWISRDGYVRYQGRGFVETTGLRMTQLSQDSLWTLIGAFLAIDFFSLADYYPFNENGLPVQDGPETTTTFSFGGRFKQIFSKHGPKSLREVQERIDTMVRTEHWTGIEAWRRRLDSLKSRRY